MPKKKRYFFSVVEEMIMNSKYKGYRGRIEVYDQKDKRAMFVMKQDFLFLKNS